MLLLMRCAAVAVERLGRTLLRRIVFGHSPILVEQMHVAGAHGGGQLELLHQPLCHCGRHVLRTQVHLKVHRSVGMVLLDVLQPMNEG